MSNSREQLIKERREKLTLDERKVEALEQIADSLVFLQSEIVGIRHAIPRKSGF